MHWCQYYFSPSILRKRLILYVIMYHIYLREITYVCICLPYATHLYTTTFLLLIYVLLMDKKLNYFNHDDIFRNPSSRGAF